MLLSEVSDPAMVRRTVARECPEGNILIGLLLSAARNPNSRAVPVEQKLLYHGRVKRRSSPLKMQAFLGYFREIQGFDNIADEPGRMILRRQMLSSGAKSNNLSRSYGMER
jgi:hypothetical protein